MQFQLQASLNRALAITAWPKGKPVHFAILHHNKSTGLQFNIDNRSLQSDDPDFNIDIKMVRNLNTCMFAQTFMITKDIDMERYDFKGQFSGLNKDMEQHIINFQREKIDLHAFPNADKINNSLYLMGFKIVESDMDYLYYFVQRRSYNTTLRKHVLRSAAIQFATPEAQRLLEEYYDNYKERKIESENEVDTDTFADLGFDRSDEKPKVKIVQAVEDEDVELPTFE